MACTESSPPSACLPSSAASLPDSIGALQQLRALALRGNRLAALPASLGGCSSLVELDLQDNQVAVLPAELGQLTSLKLLLLDNNRWAWWRLGRLGGLLVPAAGRGAALCTAACCVQLCVCQACRSARAHPSATPLPRTPPNAAGSGRCRLPCWPAAPRWPR